MKNKDIGIIINNEIYNISDYSSLSQLADYEFENKDLSSYTIEEVGSIPSRLYNKVSLPCTIEDALDNQNYIFDEIFDWANYVEENSHDREATEAYIELNWAWDSRSFEDSYLGYYDTEEDFAQVYIEDLSSYDLEDYFDFKKYGEELLEEFSDYTPEALAEYRQRLGLPPLDELGNESYSYGFIGDDEDGEVEGNDEYSREEIEEAEREYQRYLEDYSSEIYFASIDDDEERAKTFINEVYGGVEELSRNTLMDYFNLEDYASYLFSYDYAFEDGYVFKIN